MGKISQINNGDRNNAFSETVKPPYSPGGNSGPNGQSKSRPYTAKVIPAQTDREFGNRRPSSGVLGRDSARKIGKNKINYILEDSGD